MGFVERHRAEIVVVVVLPVSLVLWAIRSVRRWLAAPAPSLHDDRVSKISYKLTARKSSAKLLRTDRSVYESHSVRNSDKSGSEPVKLRSLYAILGCEGGVVHVEPGATVGEVTAYLLRHGLQLECTLEMGDATLGGLAMATGMTTHSHTCGLLHETVAEYEVVVAGGAVLKARADNAHADLWRALPWSHGSLGMLVSLKLRVVPSKPFVRLEYVPCRSRAELEERYGEVLAQAERGDVDTPFFVESLVYSREEAVLMKGYLSDGEAEARAGGESLSPPPPLNRIGLWYKPWFYKHVETKLSSEAPSQELIPIWDYLMRHDRSMCMTMATVIPYGNALWFRVLLGWLLPPQMSFLKASHTEETREASMRKQVYQDVAFPATELGPALDLVDDLFGIFPLMLYPCRAVGHGGMLRIPGGGEQRMMLNLGVYGVPAELQADPECGYPTVTRVRSLEAWIRSVGGFQHTYCDSFQTEEEFRSMFDHTHWDKMRLKYGADGVFPSVYAKTRPERDVQAFLREEEQQQRRRQRGQPRGGDATKSKKSD